jgi:RNA polymerase sigma factor (sigma-70 family)
MTQRAGLAIGLGGGTVGRAREHHLADTDVRVLYDAQYGQLAGWTARLVGDVELGHDFATEAFARLYRDFDQIDEPRAWLYTVAANLVRDHWRSRGREGRAFQKVTAGSAGDTAETSDAADTLDAATRITVREVVLALPDRLRMVVILYYYADLPVAAVAARTGKSVGAVKRDLFDARRLMAAQLEGVR